MQDKIAKRALVIVNPVAGKGSKTPCLNILKETISPTITLDLFNWDYPEQRDEITQKIKNGNYDYAIAMGGDGTVNQVAQSIIGTNTALAIIPVGSGNGLARHLEIPLNLVKAVALINKGNTVRIDACTVDNHFFFCTSGIGFDAEIGKLFATSKTRGLGAYVKLTLSNFINYKPQDYDIVMDGNKINRKAFLVTVANASQYGNNAYIAPLADIQDGIMDVSIIRPFGMFGAFGIGYKLFNKTLNSSVFVETFKAKNIVISRKDKGAAHYDGEPLELDKIISYQIQPAALAVIV